MSKHMQIVVWSGEEYFKEEPPHAEWIHECTIDEFEIPAVWGFKIFEQVGAHATHATEADMAIYRALVSVLGAGKITDNMRTMFWFKGEQLLILYSALCNIQVEWINKSRMSVEKTLMRLMLDQPDAEHTQNMIGCVVANQATSVINLLNTFQSLLYEALKGNHRLLIRCS